MLLTLILGAAAGALAPRIVPMLTEWLGNVLGEGQMPDAARLQVAGFTLALLAAALVLVLAGVDGRPVLLLTGGLLGAFHAEIRAAILARMG